MLIPAHAGASNLQASEHAETEMTVVVLPGRPDKIQYTNPHLPMCKRGRPLKPMTFEVSEVSVTFSAFAIKMCIKVIDVHQVGTMTLLFCRCSTSLATGPRQNSRSGTFHTMHFALTCWMDVLPATSYQSYESQHHFTEMKKCVFDVDKYLVGLWLR